MDNDYSLLRPFDLDAAKNGEPICLVDGRPAKFLAHEQGHQYLQNWAAIVLSNIGISIHGENGRRWLEEPSVYDLRMTPLCWVEGRPVYKDDKLWNKQLRSVITAYHMIDSNTVCENGTLYGSHLKNLTWEIPRKQIKLLAYIDGAGYLRWREESFCGPTVSGTRVPSEDKIIELEQS